MLRGPKIGRRDFEQHPHIRFERECFARAGKPPHLLERREQGATDVDFDGGSGHRKRQLICVQTLAAKACVVVWGT